ncbi:MAG TPA: hypothetical protein VJR89_12930, partial [Polyangiales bacterium]|nr:hypothetical protein [Polyangiales bacterium]
ISDFNALVGGRKGGEHISIVGEEWGQDMVRLGSALREHGVHELSYNTDTFTGVLELARFGVTAQRIGCPKRTPLPPGWVAVNARERVRQSDCWSQLDGREPVFVVNNHVSVYQVGAAAQKSSGP